VIRLAVRVRRADAELVLAELLELAPAGVEESTVAGDVIEYAVYGAPGELPSLPDLQAAAGEALVEVSSSETADDWLQCWQRFHRPVCIEPPSSAPAPALAGAAGARCVPSLYIRPPWADARRGGERPVQDIVIDPGQAFGTGAHASTQMCLQLLLALACREPELGALLDLGTGSGVLAIAAARIGFAPVLALDHDRESVQAARANGLANDVELDVQRFDLRARELPWLGSSAASSRPITLVANLLRPLLLELARSIEHPPTHLIASGLLAEQADEVAGAFAERLGLRERAREESGEWAALWLVAPVV
jgi:ribosomal protein L11 methyltransferase